MERYLLIALCLLSAFGCSPSTADRPAPESSPTEIATGSEEPTEEAPAETPQEVADAPAGRLALTQCDPENRPQACTKDYRPVCAEVDNGIRCIRAPCPSTEQREFSNGCTACSDAKTVGYWPVPCAQLTTTAP
jgi:hypothetical protein